MLLLIDWLMILWRHYARCKASSSQSICWSILDWSVPVTSRLSDFRWMIGCILTILFVNLSVIVWLNTIPSYPTIPIMNQSIKCGIPSENWTDNIGYCDCLNVDCLILSVVEWLLKMWQLTFHCSLDDSFLISLVCWICNIEIPKHDDSDDKAATSDQDMCRSITLSMYCQSIDRRNRSHNIHQTSRSDGSDVSDRMNEMRNDQEWMLNTVNVPWLNGEWMNKRWWRHLWLS